MRKSSLGQRFKRRNEQNPMGVEDFLSTWREFTGNDTTIIRADDKGSLYCTVQSLCSSLEIEIPTLLIDIGSQKSDAIAFPLCYAIMFSEDYYTSLSKAELHAVFFHELQHLYQEHYWVNRFRNEFSADQAAIDNAGLKPLLSVLAMNYGASIDSDATHEEIRELFEQASETFQLDRAEQPFLRRLFPSHPDPLVRADKAISYWEELVKSQSLEGNGNAFADEKRR